METPSTASIFKINHQSATPKYIQLVECVVEGIKRGELQSGQQIPSINEVKEECRLSKDTVERAYNRLKKEKLLITTKGKGNYIYKTSQSTRANALFLINKISPYKMLIYNSFVQEMGEGVKVDLNLYHGNAELFLKILNKSIDAYDHFVVAPFFGNNLPALQEKEIVRTLMQVGNKKLVVIDNHLTNLKGNIAAVYQDFHKDIYDALKQGRDLLKKYVKLILVFPNRKINPYPNEIKEGFHLFCKNFKVNSEVLETVYADMELQSGDAYILIEEANLVDLLQQVKTLKMTLGKDLGVISYNDTPLKELLGITVMSTDFKAMGETAAYMMLRNKREVVKNVFHFIDRGSL